MEGPVGICTLGRRAPEPAPACPDRPPGERAPCQAKPGPVPAPWDVALPHAELSPLPTPSVQRESQEVAAVSSWAEIHTAARLLRVPPERLEGAVTRRVVVSSRPGEAGPNQTTQGLGSTAWASGLMCLGRILCPLGDALWPGFEISAPGKRH